MGRITYGTLPSAIMRIESKKVHTYVRIYIYIHIHIHVYIYIHVYVGLSLSWDVLSSALDNIDGFFVAVE